MNPYQLLENKVRSSIYDAIKPFLGDNVEKATDICLKEVINIGIHGPTEIRNGITTYSHLLCGFGKPGT